MRFITRTASAAMICGWIGLVNASGAVESSDAAIKAQAEWNLALAQVKQQPLMDRDLSALRGQLLQYLDAYPVSYASSSAVRSYLVMAAAAGPQPAQIAWQSFLSYPDPGIRKYAEVLMRLVPLMQAPVDLQFIAVDGSAVNLAQLRGQLVLIDFWAVGCRPCVEQMPQIKAIYDRYHAQGFQIIGISLDKDPKVVLDYARKHGLSWKQRLSGKKWDDELCERFAVQSLPNKHLIDRSGRLVAAKITIEDLESVVKHYLEIGR